MHCGWECKLVQPLWKIVTPQKIKNKVIQQFHSWVYYLEKTKTLISKDKYTSVFIAALFTIVKTWRRRWHPLQYPCLENPMDRGAWWAAVHVVAKSRTRLSDFPFPFHFHALEKEMVTPSSVLAWRIPVRGSLVGCRLWGRTESDMTEET